MLASAFILTFVCVVVAYHKSVNSIDGAWPGNEIFCLASPIYPMRYSSLFYFAQ